MKSDRNGLTLRDYRLMTEAQKKRALNTLVKFAFSANIEDVKSAFVLWKMVVFENAYTPSVFWLYQTPIYQRELLEPIHSINS